MTRKLVLIAALVLVVGAVSTGFAIAAAGGDEQPLTGSDLEQAKAAALAHTGFASACERTILPRSGSITAAAWPGLQQEPISASSRSGATHASCWA